MSHEPVENSAAAICANEVKTHAFGQYAAALFISPEQRRALHALYAFNNELASVRNHISQPLPGEIRLQWWTDAVGSAAHGGVEGHPIAAELLKAVQVFCLPVDDLERLVEAHRFDLYDDPMSTMDALESHLINTDSILFSLATRICAPHLSKPDEAIHHAGLAQGLVRIIGLLPTHAARRKLYLPQQLLELNAVNTEDIFAGKMTMEIRTVLEHLNQTARAHLDRAFNDLAQSSPDMAVAFLPLALIRQTLQRMDRIDFNPFRQAQASRMSILWTLWRASRRAPFKI